MLQPCRGYRHYNCYHLMQDSPNHSSHLTKVTATVLLWLRRYDAKTLRQLCLYQGTTSQQLWRHSAIGIFQLYYKLMKPRPLTKPASWPEQRRPVVRSSFRPGLPSVDPSLSSEAQRCVKIRAIIPKCDFSATSGYFWFTQKSQTTLLTHINLKNKHMPRSIAGILSKVQVAIPGKLKIVASFSRFSSISEKTWMLLFCVWQMCIFFKCRCWGCYNWLPDICLNAYYVCDIS